MNPDLVLKQFRTMYVVDLTISYDSSVGFKDHQASRNVAKYEVLRPLLLERYQLTKSRSWPWELGIGAYVSIRFP